jgi:hypothetical protein
MRNIYGEKNITEYHHRKKIKQQILKREIEYIGEWMSLEGFFFHHSHYSFC